MKKFKDLSKQEQNNLRKEYKTNYPKQYKYSIHLFIIYTILGLIALSGIVISFTNIFLGIIIFFISFLGLIFTLYLLNKSNKEFYKFLNDKGLNI